jgi:hypothetical protein
MRLFFLQKKVQLEKSINFFTYEMKYIQNKSYYIKSNMDMASFFNSRATHVQPPTVTLIVQSKRKKKVCYIRPKFFECENRLNLSVSNRPENFISFCLTKFFSFF